MGLIALIASLMVMPELCLPRAAEDVRPRAWWAETVDLALNRSATNRDELTNALLRAPHVERTGLVFLLTNMPPQDLQTLSSDFLLENLSLAYRARRDFPWAKDIPEEIFLNDVLAYACLNEPRENWRQKLYLISAPLVKDCKTATDAAIALNSQLFRLQKVQYSTKRRAPHQGPLETMETGVATCTGLSILLVDACRAVGVPARVAGTPLWADHSGNHTWVEIWDGDWHFTGAAEQDPNGLDRGWFVGNASKAVKEEREHAVYASSFRKTGMSFPMVWSRRVDWVSAVNVTERYAARTKAPEPDGVRVIVDVFDRPRGERVEAQVTVTDSADGGVNYEGTSKGSTADMNDHLSFQLPRERTFIIQAQREELKVRQHFTTGTNREERLGLFLSGIPPVAPVTHTNYTPAPVREPLSSEDQAALKEAVTAFFTADPEQHATWRFDRQLERLLRRNEPAVRQAIWEAFRAAPIHSAAEREFEAGEVRFEKHVSPYTVRSVGSRPANGWPLFIAMHGGGGAPQQVNDSQWKVMQRYYRDHPELGGYLYLALRAPNNEWNGFYTSYVYPLIRNLINQFLLFADVNPNKVFLMGYSHGGYGAFAIGPKMPDRFAAIHASAAAPADGSEPVTLRNTVFSCMLGEKDTMYGRYDLIQKFERQVRELRDERADIYPVTVQIIADHPHSGLPDRDKIADIYPAVRNPVPRELTWRLTDNVIRDFFWLHVPTPGTGQELAASCQDNRVVVSVGTNTTAASVLLDSRLVDFSKPVVLEVNGTISTHRIRPRLRALCETLQRRGDPELAFTAKLDVPLGAMRSGAGESAGPLRSYPAPTGENLCQDYKVQVEGRDVPVYLAKVAPEKPELRWKAMDDKGRSAEFFETASFAYFDMNGSVKVTVTCPEEVRSAKLLPSSLELTPSIEGRTVSFHLAEPKSITLEVNGRWTKALHMFANPPEKDAPKAGDPNVVYFGPGIHEITHLVVSNNQTVYVAGGAVVRAVIGPNEPFQISGYSGLKTYAPSIVLKGTNITLRGRGIIDGSGCTTHAKNLVHVQGKDIRLEGVILRDSSTWTVPVRCSERVHVDNVKLLGYRANADGIDICNSREVVVENCFIRTLDDLIVVKTDRGQGKAEKIVARKCVLWNEVAHALSVGAELREDVDDVLFTDCDVIHDKGREWTLRVYHCDSARISNIRFENLRIEESPRLISLWIDKAFWTRDTERGHIDTVEFKNIFASASPVTLELKGFDSDHAIENVTFDNVVVNGKPLRTEDIQKNEFVRKVRVTP